MMIIKRDENLSFLILTRVLFCGIITYRIKPMRIFIKDVVTDSNGSIDKP